MRTHFQIIIEMHGILNSDSLSSALEYIKILSCQHVAFFSSFLMCMYPTSTLVFLTGHSARLKCRLGGTLWLSLGGCGFSLDEVKKIKYKKQNHYVQSIVVDQRPVFEIVAEREQTRSPLLHLVEKTSRRMGSLLCIMSIGSALWDGDSKCTFHKETG